MGITTHEVVNQRISSVIARDGESFQLESFVQDHHVYHTTWTRIVGEMLQTKQELTNLYIDFAVEVVKWLWGIIIQ